MYINNVNNSDLLPDVITDSIKSEFGVETTGTDVWSCYNNDISCRTVTFVIVCFIFIFIYLFILFF
jgi:hypothetical protein